MIPVPSNYIDLRHWAQALVVYLGAKEKHPLEGSFSLFSGVHYVGSDYRVLLDDCGKLLVYSGPGAALVVLPPLEATWPGWSVCVKNRGGASLNVAPSGTDQIDAGETSVSLAPGSSGLFVSAYNRFEKILL